MNYLFIVTDFEFIKYASHRGLEAKFQWSHDKRYYLTAQSTGSPLTVEVSLEKCYSLHLKRAVLANQTARNIIPI